MIICKNFPSIIIQDLFSINHTTHMLFLSKIKLINNDYKYENIIKSSYKLFE